MMPRWRTSKRVLALNPDHADAWLNMALSLCDRARHAQAVASAQRAVALKPFCANSLTALAHVLSFTSDIEAAAAACAKALSLDPASAPAHLRQAVIRRRLGDVTGSLASCDRPGRAPARDPRPASSNAASRSSRQDVKTRPRLRSDRHWRAIRPTATP